MNIFKVGDKIGSYCNGVFGRDDYEDKTCVAVTDNYPYTIKEGESRYWMMCNICDCKE